MSGIIICCKIRLQMSTLFKLICRNSEIDTRTNDFFRCFCRFIICFFKCKQKFLSIYMILFICLRHKPFVVECIIPHNVGFLVFIGLRLPSASLNNIVAFWLNDSCWQIRPVFRKLLIIWPVACYRQINFWIRTIYINQYNIVIIIPVLIRISAEFKSFQQNIIIGIYGSGFWRIFKFKYNILLFSIRFFQIYLIAAFCYQSGNMIYRHAKTIKTTIPDCSIFRFIPETILKCS